MGRGTRSLVFAFSSIFNPLGIFGAKPLVIAAHPVTAFLAQTIGLFATLAVFF